MQPATPHQPAPMPALAPLTLFSPSPTNPRRRITPAEIDDLADKIEPFGVKQAILARPKIDAPAGEPPLEIVFGHKRWLACRKLAEQGRNPHGDAIPYHLENLSDADVLAIQAIENIGRTDLHPLDEAEHYHRMMVDAVRPLSAEQVAAVVKVKPERVRKLLSLLQLVQPAQESFYSGQLDLPLALQVARMPATVQAEIAVHLANWGGEPMGPKAAAAFIRDRYMLRLAQAPFKPDDATLVPDAGSCVACAKRTGANPQLFDDITDADTCTDAACFAVKKAAQRERLVQQVRTSGYTVLQGDAAREACTPDGRAVKPGRVALEAMVPADLGDGSLKVADVMARAQAPHEHTHAIDHPTAPALLYAVPTHHLEAALRKIKAHRSQLAASSVKTTPQGKGGQKALPASTAAPATAAGAAAQAQPPADSADAGTEPSADDQLLDRLLAFKPPPTSGGRYGHLSAQQYAAKQMHRARNILIAHAVLAEIERTGDDAMPPYGIGQLFLAPLAYGDMLLEPHDLAELCGIEPPQSRRLDDFIAWAKALPDDEANRVALAALCLQSITPEDDFADFAEQIAKLVGTELKGVEDRARSSVEQHMRLGALEQGAPAKGKGKPKAKAKDKLTAKAKPAYRYRNPATGDTWSGRGLQPRWLKVALEGGAKLSDFDIAQGGGQ